MAYFQEFPITGYDLVGSYSPSVRVVTDIFIRARMIESIQNQTFVYYTYDVVDGDTPEILASKYYDNPNRHWIILFINNIVDPTYDWPLTYSNFNSFLESKYGSIQNSKTTTHHYEKIVTKTDSVTSTLTINKYQLDYNTYANLESSSTETINLKDGNTVTITTTKNSVSCYDYEDELNESKRRIKILDKKYAPIVEAELIAILNNNV
jgi:hypothetical protein